MIRLEWREINYLWIEEFILFICETVDDDVILWHFGIERGFLVRLLNITVLRHVCFLVEY